MAWQSSESDALVETEESIIQFIGLQDNNVQRQKSISFQSIAARCRESSKSEWTAVSNVLSVEVCHGLARIDSPDRLLAGRRDAVSTCIQSNWRPDKAV